MSGNDQSATWVERVFKWQLAQVVMLGLALLPTGIVALMALHIWLSGSDANLDWQSKIWPVVILQVISIVAFLTHAKFNKSLAPGEIGGWALQFIVYIPFGMISYWKEHVWDK